MKARCVWWDTRGDRRSTWSQSWLWGCWASKTPSPTQPTSPVSTSRLHTCQSQFTAATSSPRPSPRSSTTPTLYMSTCRLAWCSSSDMPTGRHVGCFQHGALHAEAQMEVLTTTTQCCSMLWDPSCLWHERRWKVRTERGLEAKHVTLSRWTLLKRNENAKSPLFRELVERISWKWRDFVSGCLSSV